MASQPLQNLTPTPDWAPFFVDRNQQLAPRPMRGDLNAGIGDRLRAAAFAEMQATHAFRWAAQRFTDAPEELRSTWIAFADQEVRHFNLLMNRIQELGVSITERPVSDHLWLSLVGCTSAREFCHYIADAEDRGRRAGERFAQVLEHSDPVTAKIFEEIAREEVEHIATAFRFYPVDSKPI